MPRRREAAGLHLVLTSSFIMCEQNVNGVEREMLELIRAASYRQREGLGTSSIRVTILAQTGDASVRNASALRDLGASVGVPVSITTLHSVTSLPAIRNTGGKASARCARCMLAIPAQRDVRRAIEEVVEAEARNKRRPGGAGEGAAGAGVGAGALSAPAAVALMTISEHPLDIMMARACSELRRRGSLGGVRLVHVAGILSRMDSMVEEQVIEALPWAPRALSTAVLGGLGRMTDAVLRDADCIMLRTRQHAADLGLARDSRTRVVYSATDRALASAARALRASTGATRRAGLVCVSRLAHHKGTHIVVRAAVLASAAASRSGRGAQSGRCAMVRLVGGDASCTDGLRREIRGAAPAVISVGQKCGEALVSEFLTATASCLPSEAETFGRVIAESVMCGCACLVPDSGHHLSWIEEEGWCDSTSVRVGEPDFEGAGEGAQPWAVSGHAAPVVLVRVAHLSDDDREEGRVRAWAAAIRWALHPDNALMRECSACALRVSESLVPGDEAEAKEQLRLAVAQDTIGAKQLAIAEEVAWAEAARHPQRTSAELSHASVVTLSVIAYTLIFSAAVLFIVATRFMSR